jgi:hypothetical protein
VLKFWKPMYRKPVFGFTVGLENWFELHSAGGAATLHRLVSLPLTSRGVDHDRPWSSEKLW